MNRKTNILLVDDRPENLLTLESVLSEDHRDFLSATSGAEALLMCKLEKIDLILLDYRLEDMTGLEVIRQLRGNDETAHIPVILVTALSKRESPGLTEFSPGTVDILHKPLDISATRLMVGSFEEHILLQRSGTGSSNV